MVQLIPAETGLSPIRYLTRPEYITALMVYEKLSCRNIAYDGGLILRFPKEAFPNRDVVRGKSGKICNVSSLSDNLQVRYWTDLAKYRNTDADFGEAICIWAPLNLRGEKDEIDPKIDNLLIPPLKEDEALIMFLPGESYRSALREHRDLYYDVDFGIEEARKRPKVLPASDI